MNMSGGYSLKVWVAAAIVMIVAIVLPYSTALAHPNHHATQEMVSATLGPASVNVVALESDQLAIRLQPPAAEAPAQSADHAPLKGDPQAACTESCCLLSGASCCGAAIASGLPGFVAGFAASRRFFPPQDSLLSGLSAQTLQEPPRVQL
jgi:hypothetical protein